MSKKSNTSSGRRPATPPPPSHPPRPSRSSTPDSEQCIPDPEHPAETKLPAEGVPTESTTLMPMAASVTARQPNAFQKPIRFVPNEGHYSKRRRVSSACATCRRKKTRCTGEKPACQTCVRSGNTCQGYSESSRSFQSIPKVADGLSVNFEPLPTQSNLMQSSECNRTRTVLPESDTQTWRSSVSPRKQDRSIDFPPILEDDTVDYSRSEAKRKHEQISHRASDVGDSPAYITPSPPVTESVASRLPYFRYFGPTAIVPGYKQMIVEVRESKPVSNLSRASSATSPITSPVSPRSQHLNVLEAWNTEDEVPFYSREDLAPLHPLIVHLVETFFKYMGCKFPFLNRDKFVQEARTKSVQESMLVDAVCSVAARFSTDPLLGLGRRSAFGTAFANRAFGSLNVIHNYACPSLVAVQTWLLLAYTEFGVGRDSCLWLFLGNAIRMAQDLGLHKLEGMRGERKGRSEERRRARSRTESTTRGPIEFKIKEEHHHDIDDSADTSSDPDTAESFEREKERTDTFWAIYFLDRAVCFGTGRPVTFKDAEIKIDMPTMAPPDSDIYPQPFPALIRIMSLCGRATDTLNDIQNEGQSSSSVIAQQLSGLWTDLHRTFHSLPPGLRFDVENFKHYMYEDQSSIFLLLHVWLQALNVLLNRPTLLPGFNGQVQRLFQDSLELSMSSARTIADMVHCATHLDPRAVEGNPFASQPIYIAACAALQGSSRPTSAEAHGPNMMNFPLSPQDPQQGYQKCYAAMQRMKPYWQGVNYIITVLDQKAKGILDPLLYTNEEMEATIDGRWDFRYWNRLKEEQTDPEAEPELLEKRYGEAMGYSLSGLTGNSSMSFTRIYQANNTPETPPGHYSHPLTQLQQPQVTQADIRSVLAANLAAADPSMLAGISAPSPQTAPVGEHGPAISGSQAYMLGPRSGGINTVSHMVDINEISSLGMAGLFGYSSQEGYFPRDDEA